MNIDKHTILLDFDGVKIPVSLEGDDRPTPLRDVELDRFVCPFDAEICRRRGVCCRVCSDGCPWEVCYRHPVLGAWLGVFVGGRRE